MSHTHPCQVRLFRPWSAEHFLAVLPSSVSRVAVLDRTKECGALGEPLYLDVAASLSQAAAGEARVGGQVWTCRHSASTHFNQVSYSRCL